MRNYKYTAEPAQRADLAITESFMLRLSPAKFHEIGRLANKHGTGLGMLITWNIGCMNLWAAAQAVGVALDRFTTVSSSPVVFEADDASG